MAKESAAKKQTAPATSAPQYAIPEGYSKHNGDVLGFHDLEIQGPIHGIPRGAKISDSKIEPDKPSSFVIFELLSPCKYYEGSGDEAVELEAKKGDMVGVWTKGGMRALRNLCDRGVFMFHTGEKKLKGRPDAQDPMKTYEFQVAPGKPKLIPIIEDTREKSAGRKSMFQLSNPGREPGDDSDENAGF